MPVRRLRHLPRYRTDIGSEDAFYKFQEIRIRPVEVDQSYEPAFKRTIHAFQSVVDSGTDDTVGGIAVGVIFDYQINSLIYAEERSLNSSKSQVIHPGEPILFSFDCK